MSSSSRRPGAALSVVRSAARAAAGLGAALAATVTAQASNWDFNPRVEIGGMYNDNYRLAQAAADKINVSGATLDAQLGMRLLTQTSEIALVPRITSSYFPNDTQDESTNGYFDLKAGHKTLKGNYGIVAQYANESVIYSELLPANFPGVGLGEIVGSESGRVSVINRRELERVAPTMTYDLTPRRHLHFDAEYLHASFDKSLFEEIGFKNFTAQAGMGFDLSQKTTLTTSIVGTRFEPDGENVTNSYALETQLDVHPTQITHYYFRLGAVRSVADFPTGNISTTGVTGGAGVSWTFQVTQYVLDALRGVSPSSSGAVEDHSEVRFRVVRAFRPRLSGFIGVRAIRLRGAVGQAVEVQGSDYLAGTGGFEFQMTRNYRLAGEYDYTWQRFQGEPNAAANAVALSIVYQPLSRYEPLPEMNGLPAERH